MPEILHPLSRLSRTGSTVAILVSLSALTAAPIASAQIGDVVRDDRKLALSADSPFRDPNIIYLEADELINDEAAQVLTAQGEVEGRYQDRSLRAERVVYNLRTGQVLASGNVVLVNADGSTQYADKIELSDQLEAGTASNFTARIPGGGLTAAQFVVRNNDEEIELYNAYYTACEVCEDAEKTGEKPSWRLKARKVRQDKGTNTIRYNDAVLELFGLPVFYTPYLAHPDPSAKRASGLLTPSAGLSVSKGFNTRTPYYWAIDDYTEATINPRFFTKVNPLLEYQFGRAFHTGGINIEGSLTYGSVFDRDGDAFDDPARFLNPQDGAPLGKRLRSHLFADGLFAPNKTWTYGFSTQLTTDDNYLDRYDIEEPGESRGLYSYENRRGTSQAFLVGQTDDWRLSVSSVGFQDWRSTVQEVNGSDEIVQVVAFDDGQLPIIAPKVELEAYFTDPVIGGRLKIDGDIAVLNRRAGATTINNSTDYARGSLGLDYSKTIITAGGIEAKPFANARFDQFDLDIEPAILSGQGAQSRKFSRGLGQVGLDLRYPFISAGSEVTWIVEPRIQLTQSFGNPKLDNFFVLGGTPGSDQNVFQDSGFEELDAARFWQSNKAYGYDFWQEGFRADIGGSVQAEWGSKNRALVFLGQSLADNSDTGTRDDFQAGTGLSGTVSDFVGQFEVDLGDYLSWNSRVRFDEDFSEMTRMDSSAWFKSKYVDASARYFRINSINPRGNVTSPFFLLSNPPSEEISGSVTAKFAKNWSTTYSAYHDLDNDVTRRQRLALTYNDNCTLIELAYTKSNFESDVIRDSAGFGIRVALLTLGDFGK